MIRMKPIMRFYNTQDKKKPKLNHEVFVRDLKLFAALKLENFLELNEKFHFLLNKNLLAHFKT